MVEMLSSKTISVREYALRALGTMGSNSVAALRAEIFPDKPRNDWVIRALGMTKDPSVIPDLIASLGETDPRVFKAAVDTLGPFGAKAIGALDTLRTAVSLGEPIRAYALEGLRALGPEASIAIPEVVDCLRNSGSWNWGTAVSALGALGPLGIVAVPELLDGLSSDTYDNRRAAARLLGRLIPEVDHLETPLNEALDDPDNHEGHRRTREELVAAVKNSIRARVSLEEIRDGAGTDQRIKALAAEALKSLQ
jgi:HEAT repeat protein